MSNAALHVARTGLDAQDERMRVIANNLANVNTTGFKRDRAEFATLAYQTMTAAGAPLVRREPICHRPQSRHRRADRPAPAGSTPQGSLQHDRQSARLAIEGDGYFQVQRPDGTTGYTRAGNFQLSLGGQAGHHRRHAGAARRSRSRTARPVDHDRHRRHRLGDRSPARPSRPRSARSRLARFVNPAGLQAIGNNLYVETAASGARAGRRRPAPKAAARSARASLEGSNVNVVEELVDMIETPARL